MSINAVVLAGGEGKRLWPLSNKFKPKQFIKLPLNNQSSFQLALSRAVEIVSTGKIIVITSVNYEALVINQISQLGLHQEDFIILYEDNTNNTGMAVYYSCLLLSELGFNNLTYFFPSDHIIETESSFFVELSRKLDFNKINLLGEQAHKIYSNFGYIVADTKLDTNYYKVIKFIEKPDKTENIGFMNHNILKNIGIYIAKPSVLLNEFNSHYNKLPNNISKVKYNQYLINHRYKGDSLDKMIAEKSFNLNVYQIQFFWRDIGSYDNLYEVCKGHILSDCEIDFISIDNFNKISENFSLDQTDEGIKLIKK